MLPVLSWTQTSHLSTCQVVSGKRTALTPAEKQKRYRERCRRDPVKFALIKKKHLARYHATKRLAKHMTPLEHAESKLKWRIAKAEARKRERPLCVIRKTRGSAKLGASQIET